MVNGQDGSWIVLKLAGASVSNPSSCNNIADAVKALRAAGARVLLVAEEHPQQLAEHLRARGHDVASNAEAFTPDPALERRLAGLAPVVVTQGSDISAAHLAAQLRAERLEIWADVPGMFSANPHTTPAARLLRALHYDEAQEIASSSATVLHPRSIAPVRQHQIPVHVHAAHSPQLEGTVISGASGEGAAKVKAVCIKKGITLVSMESPGMWHEVGFLAGAFGAFKKHGISVDLVSTSETNVTVSLDPAANALEESELDELVAELSASCHVRVLGPCAAVSLVGRNIRAILHQLGDAFELFEEQKIYLVTQAANDLNFTFVVDEAQGDRLVVQLHELLIRPGAGDRVLGPTWEQLFAKPSPLAERPQAWWQRKRAALIAALGAREAAYVYDRESVLATARALRDMKAIARVLYAMKANPHAELLALAHREGLDMECVSQAEIERVLEVLPSIERQRVLFTPNFAPRAEYEWAYARGVRVTIDNLYALESWPEMFSGREAFVRIDPGAGRGHHQHVRTAGARSKFGIPVAELDELGRLARQAKMRIVGLHAHLGSGILDAATWAETAELLAGAARQFPGVRVIDVGGGLGVPERSGQPGLDLQTLDDALMKVRSSHPTLEFWIEPGRFLIANAGVLLARVTQTKSKGEVHYVGVATGMNSLIRPALYGAYHEIVNLSRLDEPATELVNVVGPICESGDILGHDRLLPPTREGDVLLIGSAGAYGRAMASSYNLRPPAEELWI